MIIKLRPHHIKSFLNFNLKKEYNLSDDDFVESFCSRNKKMCHNRKFIIYWKNFCLNLHLNPKQKISFCKKDDVICKNCDIHEECNKKTSELHKIALRLDEKAKQELNLDKNIKINISDLI
jgi:hypothetical protein